MSQKRINLYVKSYSWLGLSRYFIVWYKITFSSPKNDFEIRNIRFSIGFYKESPLKLLTYKKSSRNTSHRGKKLVMIAPSTNKSSVINFCDENIFYDLLI